MTFLIAFLFMFAFVFFILLIGFVVGSIYRTQTIEKEDEDLLNDEEHYYGDTYGFKRTEDCLKKFGV